MMMEQEDQDKSQESSGKEEAEVQTYQGTDVWTLVEQLESEKQRDPSAAIRLVSVYEQILEQVIPNSNLYASLQTNLGLAYSGLSGKKRTDNLKKAIICYQEALRIWTPETEPRRYARTQTNLGNAYHELPTGDYAANQRMAITCFREALRFLTPETEPYEYAATQVNLGTTYSALQVDDRATNLKQAVACYYEALRIWTSEKAPYEYALVQTFLGTVYSELPTGDRAANLKQAIAFHRQALSLWTLESAPFDYAMAQASLGRALSELPMGDRVANLKQAITCYQEALLVWTPETALSHYITAYINLGNIYSELPTGDRAANLKQAIACYQEALLLLSPETDPLNYALIQANLALALGNLPTGDRAVNLKQAIICHHEALRFYTPEDAPLEYARVQTNLGITYAQLPTGDRAANLELAIACYQEALRFRTSAATPFNYAVTQLNLGIALSDLPIGDHLANLKQAIACYQEALQFFTPENAAFDYAAVQINLGNVYSELITEDDTTDLNKAIACYHEALRFFTLEAAPADCRRVGRILANLHFEQKNWAAALDFYNVAMKADERLYRTGLSAESKVAEIDASAVLYRRAAFSAVRLGKIVEALLILERGKTRLLTETLRLNVPRPSNIPDGIWQQFEQSGVAFRSFQSERSIMHGEERDLIHDYAEYQRSAETMNAALDDTVKQIRHYAPDFLRSIDLPTIQALLPDAYTAIVAFCITDQGTISITVSRQDPYVQAVELPSLTRIKLRRLFVEVDSQDGVVGGWLGAYYRYRMNPTLATSTLWQKAITYTLAELGQHVLTPLLSALPSAITRIIFLPSAELFLFPLHAIPLSNDSPEYLCDRYQISYAPSIEVLANVQTRIMRNVKPDLYAVINPQTDPRLVFTLIEGGAIAPLFAQSEVDKGQIGTKQRVIAGVRGRSYLHFSCHGSYNWDDPAESGLELADKRLTLSELQHGIMNLFTTRLVTLSACETGITDVLKRNAEEYVGIPAGFLIAGVPCVVSSLWSVPDLSTALLMQRFYSNHLNEGMEIAVALRNAQLWVRNLRIETVARYIEQWDQQSRHVDKGTLFKWLRHYRYLAEQNPDMQPFAHPYYWAAFTMSGL